MNKKNIIIIGLITLLVFIAAIVGIYFLFEKQTDDVENMHINQKATDHSTTFKSPENPSQVNDQDKRALQDLEIEELQKEALEARQEFEKFMQEEGLNQEDMNFNNSQMDDQTFENEYMGLMNDPNFKESLEEIKKLNPALYKQIIDSQELIKSEMEKSK